MYRESRLHNNIRHLLPLIMAASVVITSTTTAAASPPSTAGQLELEEYKKTTTIEVNVSQSKLFLTKNKIVRTSVGDLGIAEPVVMAENVLVLLGKAPGETTLQVWDDLGSEVHINVLVGHDHGFLSTLLQTTHTVLLERLERQLKKSSEGPHMPGKLKLKECPDPRDLTDSVYNARTANGLELLSKVQATTATVAQKLQTQQVTTIAAPQGQYSKTSEDIVSFPGGEKVVVASGFKIAKTNKAFDLAVSQSRTFRSKTRIVKFVTTDPRIAEPIPLSENEFVLLGKAPGSTRFEMLDELGNILAIELHVKKLLGGVFSTILMFSELFAKRHESRQQSPSLPAFVVSPLGLFEQQPSKIITLRPNQPKFYNSKHSLVRTAVADPGNVAPVMISSTQIAFVGKRPGSTTIFLWDDAGNLGALKLEVSGRMVVSKAATESTKPNTALPQPTSQDSSASPTATPTAAPGKVNTLSGSIASGSSIECETWTGSRKDIITVALGKDIDCISNSSISSSISGSNSPPAESDSDHLVALNNEGVKAINAFDYARAIDQLEKALKLDHTYKSARQNLAITYNNFGLSLQDKPAEAISYFHHAVYLDANNLTSKQNLEGIIRKLGKNPDNFDDRLALGDEALSNHDTRGGIIEYEAALRLKEDPAVRTKLAEAVKALEKSGRQHL